MSSRFTITAVGLSCFLALPTAASADTVIDTFTDPFPPQITPVGSLPMIWVGQWDNYWGYDAYLSQLAAHVVGGRRTTSLHVDTLDTLVKVRVYNGALESATASGGASSGTLTLEYGSQYDRNHALNLDLRGECKFKFILGGAMTSTHPLKLQVTVMGRSKSSPNTTTTASSNIHSITGSGSLTLDMGATYFQDIDFGDIDYIKYVFDASDETDFDYTIYSLETVGC